MECIHCTLSNAGIHIYTSVSVLDIDCSVRVSASAPMCERLQDANVNVALVLQSYNMFPEEKWASTRAVINKWQITQERFRGFKTETMFPICPGRLSPGIWNVTWAVLSWWFSFLKEKPQKLGPIVVGQFPRNIYQKLQKIMFDKIPVYFWHTDIFMAVICQTETEPWGRARLRHFLNVTWHKQSSPEAGLPIICNDVTWPVFSEWILAGSPLWEKKGKKAGLSILVEVGSSEESQSRIKLPSA